MICRLCRGTGLVYCVDASPSVFFGTCEDCELIIDETGEEPWTIAGSTFNGPPVEDGPWWEPLWAAWTDMKTSD